MNPVLVPDGPDAGLPWHYGDPLREQRRMMGGHGGVMLSRLASDSLAVIWQGTNQPPARPIKMTATRPSAIGDGRYVVVQPSDAGAIVEAEPVGIWAYEALRIAARLPRDGIDIVPGPPNRRLRLVHMDGSTAAPLPPLGTALTLEGREVGRLGSSAQHYELGPIGLALIADSVPVGTTLSAGGLPVMVAAD